MEAPFDRLLNTLMSAFSNWTISLKSMYSTCGNSTYNIAEMVYTLSSCAITTAANSEAEYIKK